MTRGPDEPSEDYTARLEDRIEELERLLFSQDTISLCFHLPHRLTLMEARIVSALCAVSPEFLSPTTLVDEMGIQGDRTIMVHISRIRKKLSGLPIFIHSSYGRGYALEGVDKLKEVALANRAKESARGSHFANRSLHSHLLTKEKSNDQI